MGSNLDVAPSGAKWPLLAHGEHSLALAANFRFPPLLFFAASAKRAQRAFFFELVKAKLTLSVALSVPVFLKIEVE